MTSLNAIFDGFGLVHHALRIWIVDCVSIRALRIIKAKRLFLEFATTLILENSDLVWTVSGSMNADVTRFANDETVLWRVGVYSKQ